jgi:ABC-2 type transport system ATP-binding protein
VYKGDIRAVDGINFTVEEGEIFGFLGPNGAGKTTTISMLCTLLRPTAGTASVDGKDVIKEATKVRQVIGLVPQELTVDDELSGRENMMLQADLYNVPIKEAKERIEELLKMVRLEDAAERMVKTYSGGMRKRLEIAEGLIHRPKVLFLDEPTLGLDVQTRAAIWEHIRHLRSEFKMTILMTTHYLEEADNLCDRIALIDHGKLVALDTPATLKRSLGGDVISMTLDKEEDLRRVLPSR